MRHFQGIYRKNCDYVLGSILEMILVYLSRNPLLNPCKWCIFFVSCRFQPKPGFQQCRNQTIAFFPWIICFSIAQMKLKSKCALNKSYLMHYFQFYNFRDLIFNSYGNNLEYSNSDIYMLIIHDYVTSNLLYAIVQMLKFEWGRNAVEF